MDAVGAAVARSRVQGASKSERKLSSAARLGRLCQGSLEATARVHVGSLAPSVVACACIEARERTFTYKYLSLASRADE